MDKKQLSRVLREWTGEHTVASSWLSAATCFEFSVMPGVVRIVKEDEVAGDLIWTRWVVRYKRLELSRSLEWWLPSERLSKTDVKFRRFSSKEEALGVLIEYLKSTDELR